MTVTDLAATPLLQRHLDLGAKIVPFAGWSMPLRYGGTLSEHQAVRESCGVFDVSHMGLVSVTGAAAASDLQRLLSNDVAGLSDGQAQYTLLTNERGGIEDDLICYRHGADGYWLIVNAANRIADVARLTAGVSDGTTVKDISTEWGILAVQGPAAPDVLASIGLDIADMAPFHHRTFDAFGGEVVVATTGYTGEAGGEIVAPVAALGAIWDALVADDRVTPCGLGARDTLRLEVCYPLHGNDIGPDTSAVGAGLGWTLEWDTRFVGEDVLADERRDGSDRKLVALKLPSGGIPRAECVVLDDAGQAIGQVTSGTKSPSLGYGIAMAWIDSRFGVGDAVGIDIRGTVHAAEVAARPLYRKD